MQLESLQAVDRWVGALMDKLRQINQDQNTLVLFTGDNGYPRLADIERRVKTSGVYMMDVADDIIRIYPVPAPSFLDTTAPAGAHTYRVTVIVTFVPFGPLRRRSASSMVISRVSTPSIWEMTSPARMPAFHAGVPSSGEITVSGLSLEGFEITIPSPEKLPDCSSSMCL